MNIAEGIAKLHELRRSGALNDDEFAMAKAAVLAGGPRSAAAPGPATPKPEQGRVPWGCLTWLLFVFIVGLVAFFTNPDKASLESVCRKNMAENKAKAGMLERLAVDVLVDVSVERNNYYLFSIGKLRSRVRLGGPELEVEVLGAFGHWWFELTTLEPKSGKKGN